MRAELLEQRLMAAADAQALQARVDELQGQQQQQELRAGEPTDADGASLPPGSAADGVVTRNTDGSAAAAAEVESLQQSVRSLALQKQKWYYYYY